MLLSAALGLLAAGCSGDTKSSTSSRRSRTKTRTKAKSKKKKGSPARMPAAPMVTATATKQASSKSGSSSSSSPRISYAKFHSFLIEAARKEGLKADISQASSLSDNRGTETRFTVTVEGSRLAPLVRFLAQVDNLGNAAVRRLGELIQDRSTGPTGPWDASVELVHVRSGDLDTFVKHSPVVLLRYLALAKIGLGVELLEASIDARGRASYRCLATDSAAIAALQKKLTGWGLVAEVASKTAVGDQVSFEIDVRPKKNYRFPFRGYSDRAMAEVWQHLDPVSKTR